MEEPEVAFHNKVLSCFPSCDKLSPIQIHRSYPYLILVQEGAHNVHFQNCQNCQILLPSLSALGESTLVLFGLPLHNMESLRDAPELRPLRL